MKSFSSRLVHNFSFFPLTVIKKRAQYIFWQMGSTDIEKRTVQISTNGQYGYRKAHSTDFVRGAVRLSTVMEKGIVQISTKRQSTDIKKRTVRISTKEAVRLSTVNKKNSELNSTVSDDAFEVRLSELAQ